MICLRIENLPESIRSTYEVGSICSAGADRFIKVDHPPSEFYVYRTNGEMDLWRWPVSEHSGGWFKFETTKWKPDDAMISRIIGIFFRTWEVICADIAGSVGGRRPISNNEAYSVIVDHIDLHHGDDDAFDAFVHWHYADFDGSTVAITKRLNSIGF